jgi:hypothetical protein
MKKSRAIVVSMVLGWSGAAFGLNGAAFAQDPAPAPRVTGRATERAPAQSRVRQEVKEGQLSVVRTVDAPQWQPGAPITMQVVATAPEGMSLHMPELGSTFGRFDVAAVMLSYAATLALLAVVGLRIGGGWPFFAGLLGAAGVALYHFTLIRNRSREGCFKAFNHNTWFGAVVFAGILLDQLSR